MASNRSIIQFFLQVLGHGFAQTQTGRSQAQVKIRPIKKSKKLSFEKVWQIGL
jgi:hypothetical protein